MEIKVDPQLGIGAPFYRVSHLHTSFLCLLDRLYLYYMDWFTSPEFIAFATMYQKTFPSKFNYPEYMIDYDSYARFLTGRVAMMSDGTWSLTGLARDLAGLSKERREALNLDEDVEIQAFEWGVFENPSATGHDITGPVRSIESASGIYLSCIDKGPDQVDMAIDFDFMQFWLSAEGYQAWVDGA